MPETMTQTKPEQETVQISASQGQLDVLDQLLKPEVQESLTTLVEQLPKLTELVNILTKSYDFAQTVATDEVLKSDTVGAITELVEPVKDTVKAWLLLQSKRKIVLTKATKLSACSVY